MIGTHNVWTSTRTVRAWVRSLALLAGIAAIAPLPAAAQQVPVAGTVVVAQGQSALLVQPVAVQRVSIGDPSIADAVVISPLEVLVNGIALGTTTLIIWDQAGGRRSYTVEVTVDATALQRTLQTLFPAERVQVAAVGNMVILTGTVADPRTARQIRALAEGTGAIVIDNLVVAAAQQILLQVRVAEISRNALQEFATQLAVTNPHEIRGERDGTWIIETFSEGLMRLLLLEPNASIEGIFRAMRTTGQVRTLAEPNLIAVDGATASFLAGGEFPFPVAQGGVDGSRITIEWREFGVRLNFTPVITAGGSIRLRVAPEVSALDFGTGLTIGGFIVPSLVMRRAATEIELLDGQTFAIAGLLDNTTVESITRIPLLGDIPIIGELFRSRRRREERTELLVLVTPWLVAPYDVPPPIPTGEVETWRRDGHLRPPRPHPLPVPSRRPTGGDPQPEQQPPLPQDPQ